MSSSTTGGTARCTRCRRCTNGCTSTTTSKHTLTARSLTHSTLGASSRKSGCTPSWGCYGLSANWGWDPLLVASGSSRWRAGCLSSNTISMSATCPSRYLPPRTTTCTTRLSSATTRRTAPSGTVCSAPSSRLRSGRRIRLCGSRPSTTSLETTPSRSLLLGTSGRDAHADALLQGVRVPLACDAAHLCRGMCAVSDGPTYLADPDGSCPMRRSVAPCTAAHSHYYFILSIVIRSVVQYSMCSMLLFTD
mmetsp:Transcript_69782/g.155516  ORF Transcript_69782/g.155516 Transcript_69782/m.155516 type:complete len:249 (-) Transcript_69782:20-766(-)